MLRLVHPAREGQEGARPSKRRQILTLTPDEKTHLRAALLNLRRAFGTWARLAEVMGVKKKTLVLASRSIRPCGFPALALLTARAGGMSVEAVLTGKITEAGRCASCGSTLAARAAAGGAS